MTLPFNADDSANNTEGGKSKTKTPVDMSVWLIRAGLMLIAIAVLPFAVRSQEVVRAIATMCGFNFD